MAVELENGNLTSSLRPRATLRASIEKFWTREQRRDEAKFQSKTGKRAEMFVGLDGGQFYVTRERIRIHSRIKTDITVFVLCALILARLLLMLLIVFIYSAGRSNQIIPSYYVLC